MNLLANQLTLSSVQIKNQRNQQAFDRLRDTSQAYHGNAIVRSNLAVVQALKAGEDLDKGNVKADSPKQVSPQPIIESLIQLTSLTPLSYIPYYNLFTLYAKSNSLPLALSHLIESISALLLQKSLKQKQQKPPAQVQRQYCSQSILVYLIKAIIHVKNQKYVIAVGDLYWVVERVKRVRDKLEVLKLIRMVFEALGETVKKEEIDNQLDKLAQLEEVLANQKEENQRLICTYNIPTTQDDLKSQISTKLKEFAHLLKQKEVNSLKTSSNNPHLIFKQINSNDLSKPQLTKQTLLQMLRTSIQQSLLYTKSQSRKLSRSRKSLELSVNQSQEFMNHLKQSQTLPKTISMKEKQTKSAENEKRLSMTTMIDKNQEKVDSFPHLNNQSQEFKKLYQQLQSLNNSGLNTSGLNTSGVKAKKKTQNIYPLDHTNQQVQIKLVMAQLTNNKELIGNMDPYCIITYNSQKQQSAVVKGGGLEPRWKESFFFNLTQQPSEAMVEVFDKEGYFKKDDFVGSGSLVVEKNGFAKVQIFQDNRQAGTVFLTIEAKV